MKGVNLFRGKKLAALTNETVKLLMYFARKEREKRLRACARGPANHVSRSIREPSGLFVLTGQNKFSELLLDTRQHHKEAIVHFFECNNIGFLVFA